MTLTRREFVAASSAAVLASRFPGRLSGQEARAENTILFQGDSITDAGRDRTRLGPNDSRALGTGYPFLLAAFLREHHPDRDFAVLNRGISGNTVTDLVARWQADTITLAPTVLSILIGVNDIWHTLGGNYAGTPEKYEAGYRDLLAGTRRDLPNVRLVVMEPFVLRTGAVNDTWFPAFDAYRAAAARVANDAGATFIPLHDMFQDLATKAAPSYWLGDGVHPTLAGHAAIAHRWLDTVTL